MDPDASALDDDVEQIAGRVRRDAHHRDERDVAQQVLGLERETLAHLFDRRAFTRRHPRQQREQTPQALARGEPAHATAEGPQPFDDVVAQLRRAQHLGVLEEAEHERAEAVEVGHRHLEDDGAVVAPSTTASLPASPTAIAA